MYVVGARQITPPPFPFQSTKSTRVFLGALDAFLRFLRGVVRHVWNIVWKPYTATHPSTCVEALHGHTRGMLCVEALHEPRRDPPTTTTPFFKPALMHARDHARDMCGCVACQNCGSCVCGAGTWTLP